MTITVVEFSVQIGDLLLPPDSLQESRRVHGINDIVIEINADYYELVKERLNQGAKVLFVHESVPVKEFKWKTWKTVGWKASASSDVVMTEIAISDGFLVGADGEKAQ